MRTGATAATLPVGCSLTTGVSSMKRLPKCSASAFVLIPLCALLPAGAGVQAQSLPPFAHSTSSAARPTPAGSWRVAFDDGAASNGTISFRIWPSDDSPIHVDVPVLDGETEVQMAETARDVLAARLGVRYLVVVVDGTDVVVRARRGTPAFTVELLRDTARDVDVAVQRD